VANNQLSKGVVQAYKLETTGGGVKIGDSTITGVVSGSVSINPPSIAATTRGAVNVTITGLSTSDIVVVAPPATLNDDLIFCGAAVTAANTLTVYLYNPTGSGIDDTAKTWTYKAIKVS
jgi:hypothetical protein